MENYDQPQGGREPRVGEAVTFDLRRSLINVLGEEHYPYAEFLYHELAANAWDEDATVVRIDDEPVSTGRGRASIYDITVTDNGNGMDFSLLEEYFRVGESQKRTREVSDRLHRPLIGRIGVGKVAILKVARRWTITTERHLGLAEPVRLAVRVDVDSWISGETPAFPVEYLEPTGKSGTTLVLEGVQARLREDRILRHLQRLPLSDDFMIWRRGQLVPPRSWYGTDKQDIDVVAKWVEDGIEKSGPIRGEIWIRPEQPRSQQAYLVEPANEKQGLKRDAAGIEVHVNGDVIVRELFGHESHAHGLNRIWGWVEAPWLPILGNRTNYLVDTPAGQAFYNTVKAFFDQAFNKIRYQHDKRALNKRRLEGPTASAASITPAEHGGDESAQQREDETTSVAESGSGPPVGSHEESETEVEWLASRYGEVINQVLSDKPECAPVVDQPAVRQRGRPAKDRIYPVRPTGRVEPFEADAYGKELAIIEQEVSAQSRIKRAVPGRTSRKEAGYMAEQIGEVIVNTTAGVRLRFVPLGGLEAPYRWDLTTPDELTLEINTDHKLYQETDRPGGPLHRFHCAWVVSLALAELQNPSSVRHVADFLETFSYELLRRWSSR